MSDWSPNEVSKLYPKRSFKDALLVHPTPKQVEQIRLKSDTQQIDSSMLPIADEHEVEQKLSQIIDQRNQPVFSEIAHELEQKQQQTKRVKRNSVVKHQQRLRSINLDDLMRDPNLEKNRVDERTRVVSNNPNYEELELASFADTEQTDDKPNNELPTQLAAAITKLPGYNYLSSLVQNVQSAWGSDSAVAQKAVNKPVPNGTGQTGPVNDIFHDSSMIFEDDDEDEFEEVDNELDWLESESNEDIVWIDYRQKSAKCYMSVRSQGSCGSCYAFATIALYEWHYCSLTGQKVALSEQYVIDCGYSVNLHGCDGGLFMRVRTFVNNFGLELRQNYPYRDRLDQCPYELNKASAKTVLPKLGYLRMQDDDFKHVHYTQFGNYLQTSPMVLNIRVSDKFSEYGGGVDDPTEHCEKDRIHSMLLIGHGRQDGLEYWLLRNSHSVSWGEFGHYKLSKSAIECFDNDHAYYLSNVRASPGAKQVSQHVRQRYGEYLRHDV